MIKDHVYRLKNKFVNTALSVSGLVTGVSEPYLDIDT